MAQWLLLVLCGFSAAYAQTCSTIQEGDVRLARTDSITLSNAGLVEVCHNGMWGTVCANSFSTPWSEKNAQVVCRQLGFSGALNSILQDTLDFIERPSSSTPIHYRSVRCLGQENRLTDCLGISEITTSCSHNQDAYIVCRPSSFAISPVHTAGPQHGDIRLFGDSDNGQGAVEFYHRSFGWTGICPDSSWGTSDATVACRQLGYETGRAVTYGSISSSVISHRLLSNFACNVTTHTNLTACSFSTTSSCLFTSTSFAGIQCSSSASTGSVRLFGGSTRQGIVEVLYDGRWGPICSSSWGSSDARVVCGELGFNRDDASSYTSTGTGVESNLKPIWLTSSTCASSDTRLTRDCSFARPTGFVDCRSSRFAGADCGSESDGLSAGAIGGIVFAVFFVIGGLIVLWFIKGKEWWSKRQSYSWYQTMTHPGQWISWSPPSHTNTARVSVETTTRAGVTLAEETAETTTTTTTRRQSSSSSSSSDSEAEPPPQHPEAEITKAAPPSYHAASKFPTADPSQAPPIDLPPPYLGLPADLRYSGGATAGYPPPANYPPMKPNYQGYPPPTNPAYPPSSGAYLPGASAPELAFPPNTGAPYPTTITTDTQQQSGGLPYPTGDPTPYPPNPTDITPYPSDITPYPSHTVPSAPPPQLDTPDD